MLAPSAVEREGIVQTGSVQDSTSWEHLLDRIRAEYDEMPGLNLTLSQAARFWDLDPKVCRNALESLVREGALKHGRGGYIRPA